MNVVFTLCSNNYLGQAKALGTTFLKHNLDTEFVVGLVDEFDPLIDYDTFKPIRFISYSQLAYKEFAGMKERYNIVEFNTAVKPFYFEHFFNAGIKKVIYLDPDIVVYDSLNELFLWLDEHDVLLTPHTISAEFENDIKWQQIFNFVGIYNLGFLALSESGNTRKLLNWWKRRLETECLMIPAQGLFVDQIWANYFPVLFDKVKLVIDPGYNMAHWNFRERTLRIENGTYWTNQSRLKFFHFSNFKPREPEKISAYSDYTFEQRPDVRSIFDEYLKLLALNGYEAFSKVKPLIKLKKQYSSKKMTGMRIKAHGTRILNSIVKVFFDA